MVAYTHSAGSWLSLSRAILWFSGKGVSIQVCITVCLQAGIRRTGLVGVGKMELPVGCNRCPQAFFICPHQLSHQRVPEPLCSCHCESTFSALLLKAQGASPSLVLLWNSPACFCPSNFSFSFSFFTFFASRV